MPRSREHTPAPVVLASAAYAEIAEMASRAPHLDFRLALARATCAALLEAATAATESGLLVIDDPPATPPVRRIRNSRPEESR